MMDRVCGYPQARYSHQRKRCRMFILWSRKTHENGKSSMHGGNTIQGHCGNNHGRKGIYFGQTYKANTGFCMLFGGFAAEQHTKHTFCLHTSAIYA